MMSILYLPGLATTDRIPDPVATRGWGCGLIYTGGNIPPVWMGRGHEVEQNDHNIPLSAADET